MNFYYLLECIFECCIQVHAEDDEPLLVFEEDDYSQGGNLIVSSSAILVAKLLYILKCLPFVNYTKEKTLFPWLRFNIIGRIAFVNIFVLLSTQYVPITV